MATMTRPGRRCERPGCRAWAMRGAAFCVAHRVEPNEPDDGHPSPDERRPSDVREHPERFADLVRSGKHDEVIEAAVQAAVEACASQRSLTNEIGVLRLMLQRVVATELLDGDSREVTLTMTRLVDTMIRALRMEQTLASTFEDELNAAVTRVFRERGLEVNP